MDESVYAVVAYIARYWFAGLAILIIWRAVRWLRQDVDRQARARRTLPDAGFIGEWAVVASDVPRMPVGTVLRAPRDGWIGSARACDVRLLHAGVPARAARFYLREDGLHLLPQRRDTLLVDGEAVQREAVLRHGATLTVGGVTLQLRLFAGVILTGERQVPWRGRRTRREEVMPAPEPILEMDDEADEYETFDEELPEIQVYELDEQPEYEDDTSVRGIRPALTVRNKPRRRGDG